MQMCISKAIRRSHTSTYRDCAYQGISLANRWLLETSNRVRPGFSHTVDVAVAVIPLYVKAIGCGQEEVLPL